MATAKFHPSVAQISKKPPKVRLLAKSFALIFLISGLTCAEPKNGKLLDVISVSFFSDYRLATNGRNQQQDRA